MQTSVEARRGWMDWTEWQARLSERVGALVTGAVLFAVFLVLFATIQYATEGLAGNDGYYHVKMGYLMRQEGLTPAFTALPESILNEQDFYDHHLLYHLYLALFAATDPATDGGAGLTQSAKIASIVLPSLAFLAIWWLLRRQQVPLAAVWAIGLFAVSEAFLYRMSMPRAQSGSLLLLVLALAVLLQGRFKWLAPLGFVYVWFYNAFPLLLMVAGVYVIAVWLLERRIVWAAIIYPALGIALGLVINPYFPQNLVFIAEHLLPKVGESSVPVGNEWSPYRTWTLVENSGPALAAVLLGALAMGWRQERLDRQTLVALGLVALFGFMLFKSRRFVEYFPPMALLFLAFSVRPLLAQWLETLSGQPVWKRALPVALVGLILGGFLFTTISDARELMADSKPAGQYAQAMRWLNRNAPPEARVFQTDWDDFTRLFFYNDDFRYTAGLDPTFLERYDQELYEDWIDITRGDVAEPGPAIAARFGAQYVFSDLKHDDFLDRAAGDPSLVEVYRDEDAVIFAVQPAE